MIILHHFEMQQEIGEKRWETVLIVMVILFLLTVRLLLIFSYSVDLDGMESAFVIYVQRLTDNQPLYGNPTDYPYFVCLFLPTYIYVLKFLVEIFGAGSKTDPHVIFIIGRAFSFSVFLLQVCLSFFYCKKRFLISNRNLLFGVMLYLLLISGHMYVMRPDALKVLFFNTAILFLVEYTFFTKKNWILLSAVFFFLLSTVVKQDMLIYSSLILLATFLFRKDYKYFLSWMCYMLLLVVWLSCYRLYFGAYFFDHVVLFNFQKLTKVYSSFNLFVVLLSLSRLMPIFLFLFFYKTEKRSISVLLKIWTAVFLVVSHFFMLRAGSYLNYGYETVFLLVFALLVLYSNERKKLYLINYKLFTCFFLLYLFATNYIIHSYNYSFKEQEILKTSYMQKVKEVQQIHEMIQDKPIFVTDLRNVFFYHHCNLIYGYDYNITRFMEVYLPLKVYKLLPKGVYSYPVFFNPSTYNKKFLDGSVPYIASPIDRDFFIKKYYSLYQPADTIGSVILYKYKN
ncbi:MAG TPA: hypothetical protein PKO18_04940 [Chitinophagales bacterium]|nr:hypothetical protein [Chitinophagales bacterium]HNL84566.1 hypothetical protein [Chitinophagales bacterium]